MTYALVSTHCDWSMSELTMNVSNIALLLLDTIQSWKASWIVTYHVVLCDTTSSATSDLRLRSYRVHANPVDCIAVHT